MSEYRKYKPENLIHSRSLFDEKNVIFLVDVVSPVGWNTWSAVLHDTVYLSM